MDAIDTDAPKTATSSTSISSYSSRKGALVWFFRKSRDRWKAKSKDLNTSIKKLRNRIADLIKSRDKWKLKAEQSANQIAELKSQVVSFLDEIAALSEENAALKKKK